MSNGETPMDENQENQQAEPLAGPEMTEVEVYMFAGPVDLKNLPNPKNLTLQRIRIPKTPLGDKR